MPSIRRKITVGFYAFAAIIVVLAAIAYWDLNYLEERVIADQTVFEFLHTSLEMRREEKNYFFDGELASWERTVDQAQRAEDILKRDAAAFLRHIGQAELDTLHKELARFRAHLMAHRALPTTAVADRKAIEQESRVIGRSISHQAAQINKLGAADLRATVSTSRQLLVFSVVICSLFAIAVGHLLSRRVVRPLRLLEDAMRPIGEGTYNTLDLPVKDREIVSFTKAFNHMLREHDIRLQQLIQSEKLASLGTLVSGVAHELNNPLSNISSSCQLLLEELDDPDRESRRELLEQIEEQTDRARNTVRLLLDFSRQGNFQREPVALAEMVADVLVFLKGHVPPGVSVQMDVPSDLVLQIDRRKMQQVVLNLVQNAVDALGESGRVVVRARLCPPTQALEAGTVYVVGDKICDHEGETVILSVEDDGPGIPEAILSRIFDPFFTTRDVGRGSGLGLYIVEEIIQQHQGCIGVATAPNAGTKFMIKLPYQGAQDEGA